VQYAVLNTPNATRNTPSAIGIVQYAVLNTPNAKRKTQNAKRQTPNAKRNTPQLKNASRNTQKKSPLAGATDRRFPYRPGRPREARSLLLPRTDNGLLAPRCLSIARRLGL